MIGPPTGVVRGNPCYDVTARLSPPSGRTRNSTRKSNGISYIRWPRSPHTYRIY